MRTEEKICFPIKKRNINEAIERGFRFCALESDINFLTLSVKNSLANLKGWNKE